MPEGSAELIFSGFADAKDWAAVVPSPVSPFLPSFSFCFLSCLFSSLCSSSYLSLSLPSLPPLPPFTSLLSFSLFLSPSSFLPSSLLFSSFLLTWLLLLFASSLSCSSSFSSPPCLSPLPPSYSSSCSFLSSSYSPLPPISPFFLAFSFLISSNDNLIFHNYRASVSQSEKS